MRVVRARGQPRGFRIAEHALRHVRLYVRCARQQDLPQGRKIAIGAGDFH
jgi:hypothetical protein